MRKPFSRSGKMFMNFIVFFSISSRPLSRYPSADIVIAINGLHTYSFDILALVFTYLGSLWTYSFFLIVLFFLNKNFKELLFAGISFFITSVIVQVLKHIVFSTQSRPIKIISLDRIHLSTNKFLEETSSSFPSGHSATAFVFIGVISFLFFAHKKKCYFYQFVALCAASFVALSRVYFCMHFYHDVYAGALIATLVTYLIFFSIEKIKFPPWAYGGFFEFMKKHLLKK